MHAALDKQAAACYNL